MNKMTKTIIKNLVNKNIDVDKKKLYGIAFWEGQGRYTMRAVINNFDDLCNCIGNEIGICESKSDKEDYIDHLQTYGGCAYDSNGEVYDGRIWMYSLDETVIAVSDDFNEFDKWVEFETSIVTDLTDGVPDALNSWMYMVSGVLESQE